MLRAGGQICVITTTTSQTPQERFSSHAHAIRNIETPDKIAPFFYTRTERVTHKDGTVTLGKKLFEVALSLRALKPPRRHNARTPSKTSYAHGTCTESPFSADDKSAQSFPACPAAKAKSSTCCTPQPPGVALYGADQQPRCRQKHTSQKMDHQPRAQTLPAADPRAYFESNPRPETAKSTPIPADYLEKITRDYCNAQQNDYDGHALEPTLAQVERVSGYRPAVAIGDKGFRGKTHCGTTEIVTPNRPKKNATAYEKRSKRCAEHPVVF